ncbi:MAG: hypothetical protein QNJ16_16180 [Rhodobacter sp.]|nr:hypothetical protein [Rhodobacter sp.]
MTARPKPPEDFDENPPLNSDFFARAKPAAFGENARLREALKRIIKAHDTGTPMNDAIENAREALVDSQ